MREEVAPPPMKKSPSAPCLSAAAPLQAAFAPQVVHARCTRMKVSASAVALADMLTALPAASAAAAAAATGPPPWVSIRTAVECHVLHGPGLPSDPRLPTPAGEAPPLAACLATPDDPPDSSHPPSRPSEANLERAAELLARRRRHRHRHRHRGHEKEEM